MMLSLILFSLVLGSALLFVWALDSDLHEDLKNWPDQEEPWKESSDS